jgi:hypothetical protein
MMLIKVYENIKGCLQFEVEIENGMNCMTIPMTKQHLDFVIKDKRLYIYVYIYIYIHLEAG